MPASKTKLPLLIGLGISAFFLWFAMRDTNLGDIWNALAQANLIYAFPLLLAFYVQLWIKAARWATLITPIRQANAREVFPAAMVGHMGNMILPVYLGELVRVFILARQFALKYSSVLATIVLERLFDLLAVLGFAALVVINVKVLPPAFLPVGYVVGTAAIILLVILGAFVAFTDPFLKWTRILMTHFPTRIRDKVVDQLLFAATGLQSMKRRHLLYRIVIASFLQWGVMGLCTYIAIIALNIDAPFSAALTVMVLTVAAMTLPSSPGFFGTIQVCFTLGLQPYHVSRTWLSPPPFFFTR